MIQHFYQNIEGWFTFPDLYKNAVKQFDDAVFVEVGSYKGQSASYLATEIANSNKKIQIYCVDVWDDTLELYENKSSESLYECFLKNIEPVQTYIVPLKTTSLIASSKFNDESIDFIFIDASHKYEDVKNDLSFWYPKLKKNGLFAGHDYFEVWPGVVQAVDEFAAMNKLTIQTQEYCWFVIKK